MDPTRTRNVTRVITLGKGRTATVTGLQPTDTVQSYWDKRKGCLKLLVRSANGVVIRHVKLDVGTT